LSVSPAAMKRGAAQLVWAGGAILATHLFIAIGRYTNLGMKYCGGGGEGVKYRGGSPKARAGKPLRRRLATWL
jgi:hypothetical protein